MQTPTHMLVAAAVLARPGDRARNIALAMGALLPDLSIYILFAWSKFTGVPELEVWKKIYWQEPWQTWSAISNSFPLWGAVLVIGIATRRTWIWALAAAATIHLCLDFPVHHDDAHKHFWPLTDWRFYSPFSYWDPAHHSGLVSALEIALGTLCIVALWRRFTTTWVRVALVMALIAYAAVPLYFRIALG